MNTTTRIALALTCAFTLVTRTAHAAVFNIPNGDVLAFKAAITAANSNGAADTINLASGGTYTLTSIDNSTSGPTGLPPIANDVGGVDLTINGNGAKIQRSTVVGTPAFRILAINNSASVSCAGVTIANGKLTGTNIPASAGAGIYAAAADLSLTNCTLRNNAARAGGAIYKELGSFTADASVITANSAFTGAGLFSTGGTTVISNSDVTENIGEAGGFGGGIRHEAGSLTITDSRFTLNTGGNGGAIANFGNAAIFHSVLNDNVTTNGGGGAAIYNGGTLSVESSTLHGNRAGTGGAIYNIAAATFRDSTFSNNNASGSGGAFTHATGTMSLLSCTLSRNTAAQGGGLRTFSGSVLVRCATFASNSAGSGGGVYNGSVNGVPAQVTLRNTIVQQGASGGTLFAENGGIVSEGFNLASDAAGGNTGTGPGGYLNERSDIRNTSANLGPLQNNGGSTLTHVPIASSAAIDAGDDSVLVAPLTLTSDQRAAGFPRLRGTHVDIGAVESGLSLVVTTIDDHDDGNCTNADCTLREAITAANGAGSGNISFNSELNGTIQLGSALPDIGVNVVLVGPGPNQLGVRRNSGGNYRVLTVSNGTSAGPSVSIVGLKFSNGQAPSGAFPASSGGGILNDHGTLQLTNCAVSGSSSFQGDQTYGGGIFNNEGRLFVTGCTIAGNTSYYGGGIASVRTTTGTAEVQLSNSTINGNTCLGGRGGGVFNHASNANSYVQLQITNCTVSGNDAGSSLFGALGGALFTGGSLSGISVAEISDCTISDNNADAGGGIYNLNFSADTSVALRNTILKTGTRGENLLNSSGTISSLGSNLCNDAAGGLSGTGPGGYLNATGDMRETDPLLGPLQNNGGRTFTHALLNGSPAINAGDNNGSDPYDQRGAPRVGTNDIGAFEFGSVAPAPAVLSAVSRKLHGGTPFDIDLPFVGEVGIECRSGGASNDYQVVLSFANAVTYTGASVSFGAGGVSSSTGSGTNSITVNLTGMTSGQTSTITLGGVSDGVDTGDVSLLMAVLVGDTNGNGAVNSGDTLQTRNRSGQPADTTNFRSDVNADGFVNSGDTTAVRSRSGTALPP